MRLYTKTGDTGDPRLFDADLERYAAEIGLDVARFRDDMASSAVQARVDADLAEGARLHVEGTPTLFVDGRRFREPARALMAYVEEELTGGSVQHAKR